MDALIGLLPLAALLACPLMIGLCFWGMRRMECAADASPVNDEPVEPAAGQHRPLAEQIAELQERLAQLKVEQDDIAVQLAGLAWREAAQGMTGDHQQPLDSSSQSLATTN